MGKEMRELTIKDVIKQLPDSFIAAIGRQPGVRIKITKKDLPEAVIRLNMVGGYVWVPVPIKHRLALKAPYEFIIANIDTLLYPETICEEIKCSPTDDAKIAVLKHGEEALLLIDTRDVETYRKILEHLRDTSDQKVEIIEAPVMVPIKADDLMEIKNNSIKHITRP